MGSSSVLLYLIDDAWSNKNQIYSITIKLIYKGEIKCAWNLNNDQIVVGFVVVVVVVVVDAAAAAAVVIMAIHTAAVP